MTELMYFRIADKCNRIDKPNEQSSHSKIVLRGGIIFLIEIWIWATFFGFQYSWFLVAVTLAAGVSFVDDIHSLPDSVGLVTQFMAQSLIVVTILAVPVFAFFIFRPKNKAKCFAGDNRWGVAFILLFLIGCLVMVYLIPSSVMAHWIYLICVLVVLVCAYVLFMSKYYHLHEEYLKSL